MFVQFDRAYLEMNRGDTFIYPIIVNEGTELNFKQHLLKDNETIYVAIMEPGQAFEDALIKKVITSNSPKDSRENSLFILESLDTEYILTGKYYITMKLRRIEDNREIVETILPLREFWITGTDKQYTNNIGKINSDGSIERVIIYDGGVI